MKIISKYMISFDLLSCVLANIPLNVILVSFTLTGNPQYYFCFLGFVLARKQMSHLSLKKKEP